MASRFGLDRLVDCAGVKSDFELFEHVDDLSKESIGPPLEAALILNLKDNDYRLKVSVAFLRCSGKDEEGDILFKQEILKAMEFSAAEVKAESFREWVATLKVITTDKNES